MAIKFDESLKFNVDKPVADAVQRLAEENGQTPSEWLRQNVRAAVRNAGIDLSRRESAA